MTTTETLERTLTASAPLAERPAAGVLATLPVGLPPAITGLPSLAKALARAQAKCKAAPQDSFNEYHKYNYTSAEGILTAAHDALAGCDLAIVTHPAKLIFINAMHMMRRRVVLMHVSGEKLKFSALEWPVIPDKGRPLDKAFASAITTSLAYFLRDLLLMPRADKADDMSGRDDRQQRQPAQGEITPDHPHGAPPARQQPAQQKPAPANGAKADDLPKTVAELEAKLNAYAAMLAERCLGTREELVTYIAAELTKRMGKTFGTGVAAWSPDCIPLAVEAAKGFAAARKLELGRAAQKDEIVTLDQLSTDRGKSVGECIDYLNGVNASAGGKLWPPAVEGGFNPSRWQARYLIAWLTKLPTVTLRKPNEETVVNPFAGETLPVRQLHEDGNSYDNDNQGGDPGYDEPASIPF